MYTIVTPKVNYGELTKRCGYVFTKHVEISRKCRLLGAIHPYKLARFARASLAPKGSRPNERSVKGDSLISPNTDTPIEVVLQQSYVGDNQGGFGINSDL